MILIDTSVWIMAFRGSHESPVAERLLDIIRERKACTCGQVWLEFIGGYRNEDRRRRYATQLASYPWLETPREAYELAAEWVARHAGIGAGDAIIAATVKLADARLLTCDKAIAVLKREGVKIDLV